ncbi:hypothetical protein [Pleomorphomonas sp. JP5]|uniref:hypothetical protein n=1 Tax=Pleomorphomonas sp. JP5 TaxID=2942998 RepID=UPI0020448216|nr:hypothetical protein [Pleomorphomonas sp. JP5]MCM5556593.1 hypothetical protein [Pleomorphomonas sp. JP5]
MGAVIVSFGAVGISLGTLLAPFPLKRYRFCASPEGKFGFWGIVIHLFYGQTRNVEAASDGAAWHETMSVDGSAAGFGQRWRVIWQRMPPPKALCINIVHLVKNARKTMQMRRKHA